MTYSILFDEFPTALISRGENAGPFLCTGFTGVDCKNNCLLPANESKCNIA